MKLLKLLTFFAILTVFFILSSSGVNAGWSKIESGTLNNLKGIWGSSATDIFAVGGNGIALHYNGTNWEDLSVGSFLIDL